MTLEGCEHIVNTPSEKKIFFFLLLIPQKNTMKLEVTNKNGVAAAPAPKGFSLIITLTLMILLVMLSVGLLTLSTTTLRSADLTSAPSEARSNARLALMLAVGELQRQVGPDTRVTARADILDENNPPVLGVWRSWEGDNHEVSGRFAGRPIAPNYERDKEDRFLSWMVSGVNTTQTSAVPETSQGGNRVALVGENTVGSGGERARQQIHLQPEQIIEDGRVSGTYAWWVGGENQKARVTKPNVLNASTNGQWATQLKSNSVVDAEVFGLEAIYEDPDLLDKATGLRQVELFAPREGLTIPQEFYHDISVNSVGLLTNVATGGWKKDFSTFSEDDSRSTRDLPLFRLTPEENSLGSLATPSDARAEKSILYPWSSYRENGSSPPIYQHGAVSTWTNLMDYMTSYKRLRVASSGRASTAPTSTTIGGDTYDFLHRVRVLPVVARIQWVFSNFAVPATGPRVRPGSLKAQIIMTPVVTVWNPYNVEMNFSDVPISFRIASSPPVAFRYAVGGQVPTNYNTLFSGKAINNLPALADSEGALTYQIRDSFRLQPGETRIFSPTSTSPQTFGRRIDLSTGFRPNGGHSFDVKNSRGTDLIGTTNTVIQPQAKFDTVFRDIANGVGIQMNMNFGSSGARFGNTRLAYRMVYEPEVAASIYPEISDLASTTLGEAQNNPQPFMTTVFGFRMASRTHLAAKGFLQSSPLVNYTAMGGKDLVEAGIRRHYGGTAHPVNSPFDFSFRAVSQNDSLLPNATSRSQRGFIVTGFDVSDGLSRCVVAELPTRPLQSLGDLQHWDLRYENPIPPFAFNLIGNSDATPLLPADSVANAADRGLPTNLQHDDAYCANHLLFDDWFFSSIAPDPTSFGQRGRSQEDVYTEFLAGETPLPTQAYEPIPEDVRAAATDSAEANRLFAEEVMEEDSWQTIASRLQVRGMFNVNSTSVDAWRALLRHARDQEIPFITETGGSWDVSLSDPTDYVYSRFSIAGDVEATEDGSAGSFPGAAEFSGYRRFDAATLDLLAERIVDQVRLRGPFLSLSEFVNRQLSSGDLALAGAIQTALNEVGESSNDPFSVLTGAGSEPSFANPPNAGDAEYQFPQAAEGFNTYGLPGWTRQADILRPLAPILNARDDTFTIRAYGDARDRSGRITATAVCEAVVQRTRDFVDGGDEADSLTFPTQEVNQTFGRRLKVISFRWLSPSEV